MTTKSNEKVLVTHQLRRAGYKVRFNYYRWALRKDDITLVKPESINCFGSVPYARVPYCVVPYKLQLVNNKNANEFERIHDFGGKVEVTISKNGQDFVGYAKCDTEDRFKKETGRNIALRKALIVCIKQCKCSDSLADEYLFLQMLIESIKV